MEKSRKNKVTYLPKATKNRTPPSNDVAAGDLAPGRTKTKRIRITIKLLYRPTASVMQREKEHRSQHKQHVKTNWLTCAMRFCSSNLKAHTTETALPASYQCLLLIQNVQCRHAAAK